MNTMTKDLHWPTFIITIFVLFLAFSWWSLERAASRVSPVSDPNYYRHGLKYNSTSIEIQTAQALRWTVTPQLKGRLLSVQVADAEQVGISGAQGTVTFQREGDGASPAPPLPLTDSGHGLYTVNLPTGLPATLTASLSLTKDQATVQRRLLINLED